MSHEDRARLKELLEVLIEHKAQLGYPNKDVRGAKDAATFRLSRAGALEHLKLGGVLTFDCSGAIQCAYKWAGGLADPCGLHFKVEGFTGSMLAHLRHYSDPRRARVGAIVIFGPATGEHGAIVIGPGDDPLLFSHGLRGVTGPIRLSEERKFHSEPVTFLNVSSL